MADRKRTDPDWEDIRSLAALARAGTLSAAARHLHVTHATVARRLARLEGCLGQPLFDRRPEGYVPTAAGRAAVAQAEAMETAAQALAELGESQEAMQGVVRLTMARVLADGFLIPRLAGLRERLPGLDIEIVVDSRIVSLARRESDIALRFGTPPPKDLFGRRVAQVGFGFYVARTARDRLLAVRAAAPLVGFDADSEFVAEAAWLMRRFPARRFAFRGNSQVSQLLAVAAGFGIGLLPHYIARQRDDLEHVDFDEVPPPRELWLLARPEARRLPLIRAVIDAVAAIFAAEKRLLSL